MFYGNGQLFCSGSTNNPRNVDIKRCRRYDSNYPMRNKLALLPSLLVAFIVLFISIYKTASVKYVFSQEPSPTPANSVVNVDYPLPSPVMTPENFLWPAHAFADRLHASVATSEIERAELLLGDADNRLVSGRDMYNRGKIEESFVVLAKAEGYLFQSLEMAILSEQVEEKELFLAHLAIASLKHREILETILITSPEDGRAVMSRLLDTPKLVYELSSGELRNNGLTAPSNPF